MTRRRLTIGLVVVAVLAAVAGGYLAWLTVFRPGPQPLRTTAFANRTGGYTLRGPVGMTATRKGKATLLLDKRRRFSVTVTTTALAAPRTTNQKVVTAMHDAYRTVTVVADRKRTVDHRPARTAFGTAVTQQGRQLEFVLVTVRGTRSNYALSAFAPLGDSKNGREVTRRFDAVLDGFRVVTK